MPADEEDFIVCPECAASWRAADVNDGEGERWAQSLAETLASSVDSKRGDDR